MNKLIIALSIACASACVLADGATVGATPSKVSTNIWFSASVNSGGAVLSKGSFAEAGDAATAPVFDKENKKIVIDSELDKPVTFTAEEQSPGKDMTAVSFNLDTAIVPADARQNLTDKGKVAFAASEVSEGVNAYFAWLGGANWVRLTGQDVKADNASYTLDVTFDNREGSKKVQFKVDGVALNASGVEWLDYTAAGYPAAALSIDLVGSGSVTSIDGNQLTITTEVVNPTDCGPIEIQETDMAAFRSMVQEGQTVDQFIASNAREAFGGSDKFAADISVGAAYALGLVKKNGSTMEPVAGGVLTAHAVAQSGDSNGIKLGLNVTPPDTGATISYKVIKAGVDVPIVDTTDIDEIVIPTEQFKGTGLKRFTVQAIVSPAVQGEDAK